MAPRASGRARRVGGLGRHRRYVLSRECFALVGVEVSCREVRPSKRLRVAVRMWTGRWSWCKIWFEDAETVR